MISMNTSISIVDRISDYKSFENFLTSDYKHLYFSYTNFDYPDNLEQCYEELFDFLNDEYNIYNLVEELYFETDYINNLPKNSTKI